MNDETNKLPEYILIQLRDLFTRVGFRSPSMADIASSLGISKKTLYGYVSNKEELLVKVIEFQLQSFRKRIQAIGEQSDSVIEQFRKLIFLTSDLLQEFHFKNRQDLHKYYPQALSVYQAFVNKELQKAIMINLMKGADEDIYRQNILKKLSSQYLIKTIELVENDEVMIQTRMTNKDLYEKFIHYHLLALTSDKGRKMVFQQSANE